MRKKIVVYTISVLLAAICGRFIYLKYYYIDVTKYNYNMLAQSKESPDFKYLIQLHAVGYMDEIYGKKKNLYVYGQLFCKPHINKDGVIIWRDKNSKIIYWGKANGKEELKWVDNHTVRINSIQVDVKKDVYDYRRKIK